MSQPAGIPPGISSRTILVVNPCHDTAAESSFWREFAVVCAFNGWRLVQFAARRIPSIPEVDTFVFPSRLAEFRRWAPLNHRELPWLDDDTRSLHVDWEHRRWDLALCEPTIWTALDQLASLVDDAITALHPAVVLTTNKIDHPCALARKAAQHHGVPVVGLIERSPFESIWFEPDGLFAESTIWHPESRWRSVTDSIGIGRQIVDQLLANPAGFRAAEVATTRPDLAGLRRPFVFLPFDNALWTGWLPTEHPQGATDYPVMRDPATAINTISNWVDDVGGTLLVKAHPSCLEARKLFLPPVARLVDGSLDGFLAACDVTVTFNTKVAFASLAAGVPTVTLADNPVSAGGHTYRWSEYDSPMDAGDAALARGPRASDDDVATFFGQLGVGHFYGTPPGGQSSAGPRDLFRDLVRSTVETQLVDHHPDRVDQIRERISGPVAPRSTTAGRCERRRVIVAANRLVEPNAQASGIARYGWELVDGLDGDDDFELHVLLYEPDVGWHRASQPLFDRLRRKLGRRLVTVSKTQREDSVPDHFGTLHATDVVHSIHLGLPPTRITGAAARVLTVHDVLHLTRPELNAGAGSPTIGKVVATIDTTRDFVICDSENTRRDLLSIGPFDGDRVETIMLGVAPPCNCADGLSDRYIPESWDGYIVTMLQSEPRKNTNALLHAFVDVFGSGQFPGTGLVAVGSVAAIRLHRDDIDAIDRSRVVTLADMSDHELHHLLRGAQAFVYPSTYEGFGLPPLEAMTAGCPVIVVANSSLIEVVGDAGLYSHTGSVDDLAAAIRMLMSSPSLRADLARRGLQRAAEMTWARTVRTTIELYRRITAPLEALS